MASTQPLPPAPFNRGPATLRAQAPEPTSSNNKADSWIGTRSTKLVEGGISETAGETAQKAVDCLTHDFELKVKSSSDESASDESVSDHVNVIHHSDNDDEMDEHLKDQTTDSDDEEDDEMDEDDNVCQICMKEDHLTGKCPFRHHIPDPRNTKLGPRFIIICKCCHRHNVHSDDDDEWEGQAVFDPLQKIFVRDASDDSCGITDVRLLQTARSVINENLANQRP